MIVLDTSFLVAFHNSRDLHHAAALGPMAKIIDGRYGPALLPEYVFLELMTVLMARRDHASAIQVGELLLTAEEVEFVPCFDFFEQTLGVFRRQPRGVGLSFADAAIVAIAQARGAGHVASFDRGFSKVAGLVLVPGGAEGA